jgi:dihydroflavonol-4-reductase
MQNVDVLVTGATGLVGNNVTRALLTRGHRVRVLIRGRSDQPALVGLSLTVHQGDLFNRHALANAARGVDAIVHCAAHVHIGWSQSKTHRQVNIEGTRAVAEIARREQAKLVAISSVNALGVCAGTTPATETTAVWEIVRCPYSESKRAADEVLRAKMKQGLRATIVYPTLVFGPYDWKPSSGRMIVEVIQSRPIAAPSGGVNVADARDVATAIANAVERDTREREFILGGHNLTYLELWKRITGLAPSLRHWIAKRPFMAMRPMMSIMVGHASDALSRWRAEELSTNSAAMRMSCQRHWFASDRAERELGFRSRPLDETLRDAYAFLFRHREGTPRREIPRAA